MVTPLIPLPPSTSHGKATLTMTLLAAAILSLAYGASAFSGADIKLLFGPGLSHDAQIWLPSDANYTEEVKQRWAVYQEPSYLGAIKPATERDVQTIVSRDQT